MKKVNGLSEGTAEGKLELNQPTFNGTELIIFMIHILYCNLYKYRIMQIDFSTSLKLKSLFLKVKNFPRTCKFMNLSFSFITIALYLIKTGYKTLLFK